MRNHTSPIRLLLCLLTVITCVLPAKTQPLRSTQIDSLVTATLKAMPLAGIAVAVVKDGKVIHSRGYGITAAKTKEKVNENTLFAIASNSKAFTVAALGILVDEGKLGWHDKVIDYIPEFRMYNPYVTANFNIEDLLTHRSGLGLGAGDLMFFPDGSDFTVNDILKSFQYQKPVSAFRTKYDYDNLLYIVAGEVVARVSDMSWSEFVEKRIMAPLNMKRSAPVYQNLKDKTNVAQPHGVVNNDLKQLEPYINNGATLGAAGGIYASVSDLSQWMLMHLNDGKYGEGLQKQLISKPSHREMWKPHTNIGFNFIADERSKTHFNAYGLGWGLKDQNGYIVISHTGGLPGMLSKTTLVPELNLGVVVLTNTDPGGYSFQTISQSIIDSYLGLKKSDWIGEMVDYIHGKAQRGDSVTTAVWNVVMSAKEDNVKPENFTGTYRDSWFGDVMIGIKEGRLWFTSLRSPKLNGRMFFYKGNTFVVQWEYQDMPCDAFATFTLDEEGNATGIRMKGISPNIDFSFDFHDLNLQKVTK